MLKKWWYIKKRPEVYEERRGKCGGKEGEVHKWVGKTIIETKGERWGERQARLFAPTRYGLSSTVAEDDGPNCTS